MIFSWCPFDARHSTPRQLPPRPPLLAGIVVFTGLYSINLRILGKSNVALFSTASVFDLLHPGLKHSIGAQAAFFAVLVVCVLALLRWFLTTETGAALRVVGVNPELAPSLGIGVWGYTIFGLTAREMLRV